MEMQFKAELDQALKMTRREMVDDPGDMWPRLLAFSEGDKLVWSHIDPHYMADFRSKNIIGALIIKACFSSRVTVFLSDTFMAALPPGKTREDMPRNMADWPSSLTKESLVAWVNARGMKGFTVSHRYTRDANNRRVFAPELDPMDTLRSRFSYDLTSATEEAAALDALLRGRDGHIEPNA